jgi:hypothetical protein
MDAIVTSYDDFKTVLAALKTQILAGFRSGPPAVTIFYFNGGSPYQIVAVTSTLGVVDGVGTAGAETINSIAVPTVMIFHEAKAPFPASFALDFESGAVQLAEPIRSGVTGWRAS